MIAIPLSFKLISSNRHELFEERLNDFAQSLSDDDVVVSIQFSTTAFNTSVEYSALVQVQRTEHWS